MEGREEANATRLMAAELAKSGATTESTSSPQLKPKLPTASHRLSSASSEYSLQSRKSQYSEPEEVDTHAERASLSLPRPSARSLVVSRASSITSHRRIPSDNSEAWTDQTSSSQNDSAIDDYETPKLTFGNMPDSTKHGALPEPAIRRPGSIASESKRLSTSSLYSLSSLRAGGGGGPSTAPSVNGSDAGTRPTAGTTSASKALGISLPEIATSAVSVTTSSVSQFGPQGPTSAHQSVAKDSATEHPKRSNTRTEGTARANIPRSRSRAKRRFSGSTATSSHSPSSERGPYVVKEKAEGKLKFSSQQSSSHSQIFS
jgi:inositol hexakisphosphate/diphosphoinositol-pentakisphosphate kinase